MVNWDADKDRIILMGIFKFHDIKNSAPLLDYLAKEIGGGDHRLSNLRQSGKMTKTGSLQTGSSPAGKKVVTARTPRTPASARGRVSKVVNSKKADNDNLDSDDVSDDQSTSSPSIARKRRSSQVQKSYAESDASSDDGEEDLFKPDVVKKVKQEPIDHEPVATTAAAPAAPEEDIDFV
ncbi:hypothetical protein E8E13_003279 [Curvularia kusanoi]|uniref:Uncharacterized protein n=1 Tax=Curvularia kusanoi TaxID=90978 RepID=A0A9P4TAT9_CURKU|nr:hypothetical protein E8E13_003279 [Curvularia kusanoi]